MCDHKTAMIAGTIIGGLASGGTSVVGTLAGMGAGASMANTLKPANLPDVPALQATPSMPTMDSSAVAQARKESIAKMMAMGGRQSTILSQPSDVLGG